MLDYINRTSKRRQQVNSESTSECCERLNFLNFSPDGFKVSKHFSQLYTLSNQVSSLRAGSLVVVGPSGKREKGDGGGGEWGEEK